MTSGTIPAKHFGMESSKLLAAADIAALNASLATASWDVDMLVTPTCEASKSDANDESSSEVR